MQRARQPHQKAARREAILAAALELLAEVPFHEIPMAQIAERAGLAKGTLFLYFSTREELFLDVLRGQLHAWFWDLDSGLEDLPRSGRTAAVARLFGASLASRPRLRTLLAVLPELEHNLPEGPALAFRQELRGRIAAMGSRLERALGFLPTGQGAGLFMRIQALAIGLQTLAEPTAQAESARLDFATELQHSVRCQLAGLRRLSATLRA